MTPEKKREQWLKRVLPALVVVVLYFVALSGLVTDKSTKAERTYKDLVAKGITTDALSKTQQEQAKLQDDITELEEEQKKIRADLMANSGFLAGDTAQQNAALEQVSKVFKENALQVIEEKRLEKVNVSTLSKSFSDIQRNLEQLAALANDSNKDVKTDKNGKPIPPPNPNAQKTQNTTVNLWMIHYHGSYNSTYQALNTLLENKVKVLPVSLTMKVSKNANDSNPDTRLEWNLTLWI